MVITSTCMIGSVLSNTNTLDIIGVLVFVQKCNFAAQPRMGSDVNTERESGLEDLRQN